MSPEENAILRHLLQSQGDSCKCIDRTIGKIIFYDRITMFLYGNERPPNCNNSEGADTDA